MWLLNCIILTYTLEVFYFIIFENLLNIKTRLNKIFFLYLIFVKFSLN